MVIYINFNLINFLLFIYKVNNYNYNEIILTNKLITTIS